MHRWFLTSEERGNDATELDRRHEGNVASSDGNLVRPVIHGADYFRVLHEELSALVAGDRVYFTDWRGDADEMLLPGGPTVHELLCELASRGIEVRGLLWRSHSDHASFSAQANEKLGAELNEAGAEVLFDQRVRRFGSHHQKMVIIRHKGAGERDVAFVGGIDLCHGRRDDATHAGDPQQQPMDERYGDRAGWHDAAVELRGPAVADVLETFTERWDDPTPLDRRTPYRMLIQKKERMPRHPEPLPDLFPDPPSAGPHVVQLLRTYSSKRPRFPFAPEGERSVARAYGKAFAQARSFIYVEDQYLWSEPVARGIADALEDHPQLQFIAVVPRFPDHDSKLTGPPNRIGQIRAMDVLKVAAPGRVGIFDLENSGGTPIYVHAKVCIVDDVWFTIGSDNFNRRSWTSDSELTCAVIDPTRDSREPVDPAGRGDGARKLARDLRLTLWAEHLGRAAGDPAMLDPAAGLELWKQTALALDLWHLYGRKGPRPPGQIRVHNPAQLTKFERLWAAPLYDHISDPDARPRKLQKAGDF